MAKKDSLLWAVYSEGDLKAYLFGSMHVRDNIAFKHIELLKFYINQVDLYAAEMDLQEARDHFDPMSLIMPQQETIENLLGHKKFQKLSKVCQKIYGLDLSSLNRYYPMIIQNMMAEMVLSKDRQVPLDSYLFEYAKSADKYCTGVESYVEQNKTLQMLALDVQLKSLKDSLKNTKKFNRQVLKLVDYYDKGKLNKLYKISKKSLGSLRKILLTDRNYLMADRIEAMILSQKSFITIGAGHLGGEKGLIKLLKSKGFKLKPITLLA